MGKVYRVLDKQLNEEVAIKLIKPDIALDKKTIERFRNELKIARKIVHKNIGRMFDLNEDKGTFYITMEYVSGQDLKGLIRQTGQLGTGTAISIAKKICEGLGEAHKLGVVHRDLKPSNIMIDKDGNARIMDFGIARSLKAKGITGAGVMIGTPEYISPEQAEVKEVDKRSDIYSLGVILYEMLTGKLPFEGETPLGIAMKHKSEIPKDPKELNTQIPEDLSRVILKCLEKDKENRCQSAGEVRSELINIEKGIPTTEREIPKRKPLTSREITVTFGLRKLFIPALVIIAIVVSAVVILRLIPRKEVALATKIENSIAVISFKNQTGDKAYDYLKEVISDLLITNLENTGYFYVATWERMRDFLKQMGKEDIKFIDSDIGFEICRREGIEVLVIGSLNKAGDMFVIDVKVLDAETKRLVKSASSKGIGEQSILETQIDDLSREISQGMGISLQKIEATKLNISEFTTTTIEAYKYFLKGREDLEKQYYDEARQSLEKAVILDPAFASAYLYIAHAYSGLGLGEARNEALEKAKIYSEKATEKERFYIEEAYASYIERNPEKRFRILKQMTKEYPKEKRGHLSLGSYYERQKIYDKAIEEYNKALELDPKYGLALNELAYAYVRMGDYEKALEYFKRQVLVSPGDANPLDSLASCYFIMGRLDEAVAAYKEALEIKPDWIGSYWAISYIYAFSEDYSEVMKMVDRAIAMAPSPGERSAGFLLKGFFYFWLGSSDQALREIRAASDLAESAGNSLVKSHADRMAGFIYYERGKFGLARKSLKNFLDISKKFISIATHKVVESEVLAHADIKEGRIDSAKARLAEIKSLIPDMTPARGDYYKLYYDSLHAEVLLAEGSLEEAITVGKKLSPLAVRGTAFWYYAVIGNVPIFNDVLARGYRQKGELDKAIAEYERLMTFDPESKDRRLIHPKYYYRLAKLYEQKSWKGKAIENYDKFLTLWKDADPGIPEVEDARKRVAGLKNQ